MRSEEEGSFALPSVPKNFPGRPYFIVMNKIHYKIKKKTYIPRSFSKKLR